MGCNGWPDEPAEPDESLEGGSATNEPADDPQPYPDEGGIHSPTDPNDEGPWF